MLPEYVKNSYNLRRDKQLTLKKQQNLIYKRREQSFLEEWLILGVQCGKLRRTLENPVVPESEAVLRTCCGKLEGHGTNWKSPRGWPKLKTTKAHPSFDGWENRMKELWSLLQWHTL